MMSVTTVDSVYASVYQQPSSYRKTQLAYDALASRDQRLNSRQRQLLLLIDRRDESVAMIVQSLMTDENLSVLMHYGLIEPVYEAQPLPASAIQPTVEADMHQPPARLADEEVARQVEAAKSRADWSRPAAKIYDWLQADLRRSPAVPAEKPTESESTAPVQAPEPSIPQQSTESVAVESQVVEPVSAAVKSEFVLTERPVPSFLAEPEPVQAEPVVEVAESTQPAWQPMDFEAIQLLMRETLWQTCGLMGKPLLRKIEAATTVDELRRIQPHWKTSILEVRYREQSDALKQALLNVKENLARL